MSDPLNNIRAVYLKKALTLLSAYDNLLFELNTELKKHPRTISTNEASKFAQQEKDIETTRANLKEFLLGCSFPEFQNAFKELPEQKAKRDREETEKLFREQTKPRT